MSALSIQVPYQIFADSDGTPLDNGYVWIGTTNLDPRTNPVNVYFDAALTQVAPNPLRTVNGYVYNAGSPAQLYIDGVNFSIRVEDKKSVLVYSFPSGSGISPNANGVVYTPAGTGAVATTVQSKLRESISVLDFGADPTGLTDSTTAFTNAVTSLSSGGKLLCPGNFLIGGAVIGTQHITICGRTTSDTLIIKNGTTGITINQNFVNFDNITIKSQGTKGDGLGTNGVVYAKTSPVNSVGFSYWSNVNVSNFSGIGVNAIDAINFAWKKGYVLSCTTGVNFPRDSGAVSFGTTVSMDDVYVTSCTTGIGGSFLYNCRFNVIVEFCTYGMNINVGSISLLNCYFEANTTKGALFTDCDVQQFATYSNNPVTDAVTVTWTGAVAAAQRGNVTVSKQNVLAKTIGVQNNFGVDPKYFAGFNDSSGSYLAGLTFGNDIVPLVRGANLLDPAAWTSNTSNEFQGWSNAQQGYKIAGTVSGGNPYGMTQNVSLSTANTYILDIATTTVSGSGITLYKVGANNVTPGVPFTPSSTGSLAVKCYGVDSNGVAFECYVNAFSLSQIGAQTKYTAVSQQKLTSSQQGRSPISATAMPSTGTWAQGEIVWNSTPSNAAGQPIGWVRVATGSGNVLNTDWRVFGVTT